jgi:TPR repeat protein
MASFDELHAAISSRVAQSKYTEIFHLARECCDRFHCLHHYVEEALRIEPDLVNVDQLKLEADSGSASSNFLLGLVYDNVLLGTTYNKELACAHFTRAANRGHVYAMFFKGCTLPGRTNQEFSFVCILASARLGCELAMSCLAQYFHYTQRDYVQAAFWYWKRAELVRDTYYAHHFTNVHLQECIPYGRWKPERIYYRRLLPIQMRVGLFTWLLVAKRLGFSRDMAGYICPFIITRGNWSF